VWYHRMGEANVTGVPPLRIARLARQCEKERKQLTKN
jgi:hypothetical protein